MTRWFGFCIWLSEANLWIEDVKVHVNNLMRPVFLIALSPLPLARRFTCHRFLSLWSQLLWCHSQFWGEKALGQNCNFWERSGARNCFHCLLTRICTMWNSMTLQLFTICRHYNAKGCGDDPGFNIVLLLILLRRKQPGCLQVWKTWKSQGIL